MRSSCLTCGQAGPNGFPQERPEGDWILFCSFRGQTVTFGAPCLGGIGSDLYAVRPGDFADTPILRGDNDVSQELRSSRGFDRIRDQRTARDHADILVLQPLAATACRDNPESADTLTRSVSRSQDSPFRSQRPGQHPASNREPYSNGSAPLPR